MTIQNVFRRARVNVTGGAAGLVAALLSVASPASAAPHGALDMQQQQQRLDALLRTTDSLHPEGVDPVIWSKVVVPQDNALTAARTFTSTGCSPPRGRGPMLRGACRRLRYR